eukprot:COSAG01_NODE_301_length_19211_cov_21.838478_9_plen_1181_part_00
MPRIDMSELRQAQKSKIQGSCSRTTLAVSQDVHRSRDAGTEPGAMRREQGPGMEPEPWGVGCRAQSHPELAAESEPEPEAPVPVSGLERERERGPSPVPPPVQSHPELGAESEPEPEAPVPVSGLERERERGPSAVPSPPPVPDPVPVLDLEPEPAPPYVHEQPEPALQAPPVPAWPRQTLASQPGGLLLDTESGATEPASTVPASSPVVCCSPTEPVVGIVSSYEYGPTILTDEAISSWESGDLPPATRPLAAEPSSESSMQQEELPSHEELTEDQELALLELELEEEASMDARLANLQAFRQSLLDPLEGSVPQQIAALPMEVESSPPPPPSPPPPETASALDSTRSPEMKPPVRWRSQELQQQLDAVQQMLLYDADNAGLQQKFVSLQSQLEYRIEAEASEAQQHSAGAVLPSDAPVNGFVRMAKAFLHSGNLAGAQEAIEKAVALDIGHPEIAAVLSCLERELASQPEREVTFCAGPLGMGLDPNPLWGCDCLEGSYGVFVSRLNRTTSGNPGAAEQTGLVNVGDFIIEVNGTRTLGLTYGATIDLIQAQRELGEQLTVRVAKLDKVSLHTRKNEMATRHASQEQPEGHRAQELHLLFVAIDSANCASPEALECIDHMARLAVAESDRVLLLQMGAIRLLIQHVQNREKDSSQLRERCKLLLNQLIHPASIGKKSVVCDDAIITRDLVSLCCVDNETLRNKSFRTLLARCQVDSQKQDEAGNPLEIRLLMEWKELNLVDRVLASPASDPGSWLRSRKHATTLSLFLQVLAAMATAVTLTSRGQCPALTQACVKQVTAVCAPALPFLLHEAGGAAAMPDRVTAITALSLLACSVKLSKAMLSYDFDTVGMLRDCVHKDATKTLALKTIAHLAASLRVLADLSVSLANSAVGYLFLLDTAKRSDDKDQQLNCFRAVDSFVQDSTTAVQISGDRKTLQLVMHLGARKLSEAWSTSHKADIQTTAISILCRVARQVDAAARLRMAAEYGLLLDLATCATVAASAVRRKCDQAIQYLQEDAPLVQGIFQNEPHKKLFGYLACGQPCTMSLALVAVDTALRNDIAANKLEQRWIKPLKSDPHKMGIVISAVADTATTSGAMAARLLLELIRRSNRLVKIAIRRHAIQMCSNLLEADTTTAETLEVVLEVLWILCFGTAEQPLPKDLSVRQQCLYLRPFMRAF